MPAYCYSDSTGRAEERFFKMGEAPSRVCTDTGRWLLRDYAAEWRPQRRSCRDYRLECYASGVAPHQAQELRDFFKKHNESIEVTNSGDPVYTSAGQRRRLLKLRGFVDKNSFC